MASERQDALLTTSQRAFLDGKTDYSMTDSGGRATRSRIRERLHSGLLDVEYLASDDSLDERDVTQLREKLLEEGELDSALQEMVAFIYRLQPERFERIVKRGAELGVRRFDPTYAVGNVRIPIHEQGVVLERARQKMDNDDPLTEREIRVLLTNSDTDPTTLQEYVRSHPKPAIERNGRRFR